MSNADPLLMYQYFLTYSSISILHFSHPDRNLKKNLSPVKQSFCIRSHSPVAKATFSLLRNLSTPKLQAREKVEVSPILNKTILTLFDRENVSFVRALNL